MKTYHIIADPPAELRAISRKSEPDQNIKIGNLFMFQTILNSLDGSYFFLFFCGKIPYLDGLAHSRGSYTGITNQENLSVYCK